MREKSDDASRTRDEYRQREFLKSACEMREVVDQNENRTRAREETERQRDREIDTPGNETKETRSNRRVPHGVGSCCCCVCVCVCALEPYLVRRFGGRRNTRGQRREKSDDDQGIAVLEKNKEKKRELWCYFWQH